MYGNNTFKTGNNYKRLAKFRKIVPNFQLLKVTVGQLVLKPRASTGGSTEKYRKLAKNTEK